MIYCYIFLHVPRVWSALGPVSRELVGPECSSQSNLSLVPCVHVQSPDSKSHESVKDDAGRQIV